MNEDERIAARFAESDLQHARDRRIKEPGEWLTRRYNSDRIERQAANDAAVEMLARAAERRRHLRMMHELTPLVDDELAIETAWDEERRERER